MDLFLCGAKGLSALNAAILHPKLIDSINIQRDMGVIDDAYGEMISISKTLNLNLNLDSFPNTANFALAVGWKNIIRHPYRQLFVIHDSLLPKYRGWNPLVTALQNKDSILGVTLIKANEQADTGPIIWASSFEVEYPIRIFDAMKLINEQIFVLTSRLLSYPDFQALPTVDQIEAEATYSIWRNNQDYSIDWSQNSSSVLTFVDSVSYPYMGALTTLGDEKLRIGRVEIAEDINVTNRTAGKVWRLDKGLPVVLCGVGAVKILEMFQGDQYENEFHLTSIKSKFV